MATKEELLEEYKEYAKNNNISLNPNEKLVDAILKGLIRNEEMHGAKYCPCRRISGVKNEDVKNICPCDYHMKEIEVDGRCHCMLFVKK